MICCIVRKFDCAKIQGKNFFTKTLFKNFSMSERRG